LLDLVDNRTQLLYDNFNSIIVILRVISAEGRRRAMDPELEKLKMLFDYTKFHIGVYTTIATIFGGLFAAGDKVPIKFYPPLLMASIISICVAGWAGGTIASSIPGYSSYTTFWKAPIAPLTFTGFKAEYWTYIEHTAFWVAVVLALLSISVKWPV
jgi:hypothetical protein